MRIIDGENISRTALFGFEKVQCQCFPLLPPQCNDTALSKHQDGVGYIHCSTQGEITQFYYTMMYTRRRRQFLDAMCHRAALHERLQMQQQQEVALIARMKPLYCDVPACQERLYSSIQDSMNVHWARCQRLVTTVLSHGPLDEYFIQRAVAISTNPRFRVTPYTCAAFIEHPHCRLLTSQAGTVCHMLHQPTVLENNIYGATHTDYSVAGLLPDTQNVVNLHGSISLKNGNHFC